MLRLQELDAGREGWPVRALCSGGGPVSDERWIYTPKGWARADGPQRIDPALAPDGPMWDHHRKAANVAAYEKRVGPGEVGGHG